MGGISENEDLKIKSDKGRRNNSKNFLTLFFISKLGLEILQNFIDRKVDLDCTDGQQRTPLMWAASTGYKTIFFLLRGLRFKISVA